ncbi:alpha/beta hydrolase [uncultured Paraglaciecola sp.]|uniref:alpha/beta fold hydrolase n=1 Tax=uncultured Paraglaciecola sp. TaxID=1765024 RepID=UPI002591EC6B|nr:alpha/beta hydrolase [uncultured Paraglaciecola sp.]
MQSIRLTSGISINYQDTGKKSAPVIILIMGLGAQMTVWPEELYQGLVEKGFRVIRFDNRDVGLSSQLDELGQPSLIRSWLSKRLPLKANIPYKLEDMANDVIQLMTALKIKKAHLVGASMGGMIAQILAAKHKKKILSLTSIMSSPSAATSTPKLSLLLKLARPPTKTNREAAIRYNIKMNRLISGRNYPIDESILRNHAALNIDRAHNPAGVKRQLVAITSSGDRRSLLKKIKAPTLVIHGSDDPIISVAGGQDTAARIRKSKLKVIDGMGHNFPPILMGKMTKWIAKHVTKAEKKRLIKKKPKALKSPKNR